MQQRSKNSLKQKLTSRNFFSLTSRELKGKTKETMIRLLDRGFVGHRLTPSIFAKNADKDRAKLKLPVMKVA